MTQQEYFELQAMYDKEGQSVSWSIANVLRGTNYIDRSTLIAAAYVLLMANDDTIDTSSIDAFCKSGLLEEIYDVVRTDI